MSLDFNIKDRTPVWMALSELYLDTELDSNNYSLIGATFVNSPYSLEEICVINKYEVFPVLKYNLMSMAGEWAGFQEKYLVSEITRNLKKRNRFKRFRNKISFHLFNGMIMHHWEHISEKIISTKNAE